MHAATKHSYSCLNTYISCGSKFSLYYIELRSVVEIWPAATRFTHFHYQQRLFEVAETLTCNNSRFAAIL
jgi:hypothetical protein